MAKYKNKLQSAITLFRAISDENRVRALMALRDRELCVCQITELLNLAPSTVSKHMSVLKHAGLVTARKEGRWIYYRLADCTESPDESAPFALLCRMLSGDCCIRDDSIRLKDILNLDPEDLCRKQCR